MREIDRGVKTRTLKQEKLVVVVVAAFGVVVVAEEISNFQL